MGSRDCIDLYATNREVIGVDLPCKRIEYQEYASGFKGGRTARQANNLTAICELIV
jgi:hypothetical protein